MTSPLDHHANYISKYGYSRWVLRECVRANPLYAISAAVLAYGVSILESEIDPQVDQGQMKVVALALLHFYELAVLLVATVILKVRQRETSGGRDLHGLMIIMLLFLSGSFLAQDEIIATYPDYGFWLVGGALLLAAIKLTWYSRLPGVVLPWKFQAAMLAVLAGHSCAPLFGGAKWAANGASFGVGERQGLAWMLGWLTLAPMFMLIWRVEAAAAAERARQKAEQEVELAEVIIELDESAVPEPKPEAGIPIAGPSGPDFLVTRFFGHVALFLTALLGCIHLYTSDWVFERPSNVALSIPAMMLLLAGWLAFGWYYRKTLSFFGRVVLIVPAVGVNLLWSQVVWHNVDFSLATFVHPVIQIGLAVFVFYTGLAWSSKRPGFLLGVASLVIAPISWLAQNFRAWFCISLGFLTLFGGMVLSLIRQKLLRHFEAR